jgi:hypothetical protein
MQLPGRLRSTTLGDMLGACYRSRSNGMLELVEDRGRVHRIHLAQGCVVAVELDGASPSLAEILRRQRLAGDDVLRRSLLRAIASRRLHGEVLVDEFQLAPCVVRSALRHQLVARLAVLEKLVDARVVFRVAVRPPRWAVQSAPLDPHEFLHGRRRARERPSESCGGAPYGAEAAASSQPGPDAGAWRVLGISPGVGVTEIKRAYRRLARSVHPDLHPGATDDQRRALEARFVQINAAYRTLVA